MIVEMCISLSASSDRNSWIHLQNQKYLNNRQCTHHPAFVLLREHAEMLLPDKVFNNFFEIFYEVQISEP